MENSNIKVGDLVVYRTSFARREEPGIIVEQTGSIGKTPMWLIRRLKSGYSGKAIFEHTLEGDILSVMSGGGQ